MRLTLESQQRRKFGGSDFTIPSAGQLALHPERECHTACAVLLYFSACIDASSKGGGSLCAGQKTLHSWMA